MEQHFQTSDHINYVLDILPSPVAIHHQGVILYANPALLQVLGIPLEDAINLHYDKFVHPEDVNQLKEIIRLSYHDKVRENFFKFRIKKQNGQYSKVDSKSALIIYNGLECRLITIVYHDESYVLKEELSEKERMFTLIAEMFPDYMMLANSNEQRIVFRNKSLIERLGYSLEDIGEKTEVEFLYTLLNPEDEELIRNAKSKVSALTTNDQFNVVEYRLKDKSGNWRWLRSRTKPHVDLKEINLRLNFNITQDVTHEKKIEEELIRSKLFLQKIAQSSPNMVTVYDATTFDPVFSNIPEVGFLGYYRPISKEEYFSLIPEYAYDEVMQGYYRMPDLKDGEVLSVLVPHIHKSGDIHHILCRTMVMERFESGSPKFFITVATDVTDIKKAQQDLEETNQKLLEKNKQLEQYIQSNKELEKFAFIASHDLREPLRSIISFSQLAKTKCAENPAVLEFLDIVISSGNRMNEMVHGILEYSRVNSDKKINEELCFNDVLETIKRDMLSVLDENGATLSWGALPLVYGDSLQMRQLLQNLISNSLKYKSAESPNITLRAEEQENEWLFIYKDNGKGFDMKYADKVFELFTQLDAENKNKGTGLGLSLCKRILERHNGKIWCESEKGLGTTFYFTLPKHQPH